jgi:hypothetical protein
VKDSAHWAAARLNAAADQAPDKPGFFDRALGAVSDFAGGAVEATVGMAEFAFKLTPVYELIDPEGYVENLTGLGQGLVFGVTHPVEFAKGVIDWDTWVDNPARALGHLVPAVALAAATAGAGAAGKAGAAAKAVEGAEALGTTEAAEVSAARTVTRSATEVGEDIGELSGILRDAARGKGNFGLGKATRSEADVLVVRR